LRKILRDVVSSSKMQLGHCIMPTRCVSPRELHGVGQSLYFDASEINVTEKRTCYRKAFFKLFNIYS